MYQADFEIGAVRPSAEGATVCVRVPHELKYLDGHFPDNPIVPGIAQLHLVERVIRRVYPELEVPVGLSQLKFQARIDPGDELVVLLERLDDKVHFAIHRGETVCSRGNLRYD